MEWYIEFPVKVLAAWVGFAINNIFWITGSPEWNSGWKVSRWQGPVKEYSFKEKIDYIFNYRIKTVFSNIRDFSSALVVGIFLSLFT